MEVESKSSFDKRHDCATEGEENLEVELSRQTAHDVLCPDAFIGIGGVVNRDEAFLNPSCVPIQSMTRLELCPEVIDHFLGSRPWPMAIASDNV